MTKKETKFKNVNALDKVIGYISPSAGLRRARARSNFNQIRRYDGASKKKRLKNWRLQEMTMNQILDADAVTLKERARDLTRNNAYGKAALRVLTHSLVGPGFTPDFSNKIEIEDSFQTWAKKADQDGKLQFNGLMNLATKHLVRDGELIIRRYYKKSSLGLSVPLQIQVIDPDLLARDKNETKNNGSRIVHGIEYDSENKPEFYHFYKMHPSETISRETVRVPAKDIIHKYDLEYSGQGRGVSWFAPVIVKIFDFDGWEDGQLLKMKISSCFAGFLKSDNVSSLPGVDSEEDSEWDETLVPGTIKELPPGKDIDFTNPPQVEGLSEFNKRVLHAIATGLGITYHQLTQDLSDTNYSSLKAGTNQFKRDIKTWRTDLVIPALDEVSEWFLEAYELSTAKIPKELKRSWTPPRDEMIDPVKEIPATIKEVRAGLASWSATVRARGLDPRKLLEELKEDKKMFTKYGLILDCDPEKVSLSGNIQSNTEE
ncbi:phage portal protein [Halobacteriovorax sp. GB3]|uniref:phage portal protein n=1 Tax=Halobacteriovorax sp. GB3 TaxID=2719615 RepID=UPI002360E6B4|nr:phage portal protein [Halobacteriovorax sp. GB3]MDD0852988.1 phage portal protein [Halobacteriovorax sp. GB3]